MAASIRRATTADTESVADLVHALLQELAAPDEQPPTVVSVRNTTAQLLDTADGIWAFVAVTEENEAVGVLTLNECAAIYAGGQFGEITELYVCPDVRSQGIAGELLHAALVFGRKKGWRRLEVGAPEVPRWERTELFYLKSGFVEIGPRLKHQL